METADRKYNIFLQSTLENNFKQLGDFKTHIRGNVLDLVFTNSSESILTTEPVANLSNSDHSIILVELVFNVRFNDTAEMVPDWKNGDKNGLYSYLHIVKWDQEFDQRTAHESWIVFKEKLQKGVESFILKFTRRANNRPQWLTRLVKKLVNKYSDIIIKT